MIEIPLSKASKSQLEAELQMYRDIDNDQIVVPAADAEELSNTAKRIAVIEGLRKEWGVPVEVTDQFITENPTLAVDSENIGKVVLMDQTDLDASAEANEKAAAAAGDTGDDSDEAAQMTSTNADTDDLVYLGRHKVIKVTDAIAHGRTHKDVFTADGQSYRLSDEEYQRDVKARTA